MQKLENKNMNHIKKSRVDKDATEKVIKLPKLYLMKNTTRSQQTFNV